MGRGSYVEKIVHDPAHGGCGKRTLGVFQQQDGRYDGFCYYCNKVERNPYAAMADYTPPKPRIKTQEEIQEELAGILEHPVRDLPDRGLNARTLQYYGVKVGLDEQHAQEVVAHYYPYTRKGQVVGYKVRMVQDKKFFFMGSASNLEPFGWVQAMKSNHTKLFITEGEIDAMSLFKIIMQCSTMQTPAAVISIPSGASSIAMLSDYVQDMRSKFKEIIFVPDGDEPGQLAVDNLLKLIPECKVATLPLKDANEMLKAGREKECFDICMWQARTRLSGKMVSSDTLWDKARERPVMGVSWPWAALTELTRGIRTKEGVYIGAGTKMG